MAAATEIRFARRLADNDKAVRDKAVKKLKAWLRKQHALSDLDNCKLWRGLFFCMWMSDKPAVQEELADQLARLLFCLSTTAGAVAFMRGFFVVMGREWPSIDRHRVDKFYLLVRKCLGQMFVFVQGCEWDKELAEQMASVLSVVPLAHKGKYPNGLKWFVIEKLVPELSAASESDPCPEEIVSVLLQPALDLLAWDADKTTRNKVRECVFGELLGMQGSEGAMAVPWADLATRCFQLAADKALAPANRSELYSLRKQLLAAAEAAGDADEQDGADVDMADATISGKKSKAPQAPSTPPQPTSEKKKARTEALTTPQQPASTPQQPASGKKKAKPPQAVDAEPASNTKTEIMSTPQQPASGKKKAKTPQAVDAEPASGKKKTGAEVAPSTPPQAAHPEAMSTPQQPASGKKKSKTSQQPSDVGSAEKRKNGKDNSDSHGKKRKIDTTPEAAPRTHARAVPATEVKATGAAAGGAVPQSEPPKKPRVQIVLSNNKISQFNKFHRVARPDSPRAFDPARKPVAGVLRTSSSTPLHHSRMSKT